MRPRFGEGPEPLQKPSWQPTPLAIIVVFIIPIVSVIAALNGWNPGWLIAGSIGALAFIIAGSVRNDTR